MPIRITRKSREAGGIPAGGVWNSDWHILILVSGCILLLFRGGSLAYFCPQSWQVNCSDEAGSEDGEDWGPKAGQCRPGSDGQGPGGGPGEAGEDGVRAVEALGAAGQTVS